MLSLARGNIDRDAATRVDSTAVAALRLNAGSAFILVADEWVGVGNGGDCLAFLTREDVADFGFLDSVFLGKADGRAIFACDVTELFRREASRIGFDLTQRPPAGFALDLEGFPVPFSRVRYSTHLWNDDECALSVMAVALLNWRREVCFCDRCGSPLHLGRSGWDKECEKGHIVFPRTDPAVIMSVRDREDRLLLGRNGAWGPGRFSVLAGFVESGESLEAAVAREVFEETHICIDRVEYIASQPWPFPRSLMLAFDSWTSMSEADIAVDGKEMVYAHFFSREEFAQAVRTGEVSLPTPTSVAYRIIENWYGSPLSQFSEYESNLRH